jgi:phosphoribosylcarboxyaminoimidazole (NCAIR) mutase
MMTAPDAKLLQIYQRDLAWVAFRRNTVSHARYFIARDFTKKRPVHAHRTPRKAFRKSLVAAAAAVVVEVAEATEAATDLASRPQSTHVRTLPAIGSPMRPRVAFDLPQSPT